MLLGFATGFCMRVFVFLVGSVLLSVGCSGLVGGDTGADEVDVQATVVAAVEATRVVERRDEQVQVPATEVMETIATDVPTATPKPTATPEPTATLVPTPEPYVFAPGSVEKGAREFVDCLVENDGYQALFRAGMEGVSGRACGTSSGW